MAFIRNMDPKDSMKIGRKEDSIEIVGVQFFIDGCPVRLKDPKLIFNFLKRIEKLEFPDDLYRPHNIILLKKEEVEDTIDAFIQAMSKMTTIGMPPVSPQILHSKINSLTPKIRIEIKEIRLKKFMGKTIFFAGQFILMPLAKDIEEKAPWLIEDERLEDERLMEMKMAKQMVQMLEHESNSERRKQEMKYEYEKTRQEILKNATFKIKPNFKAILPF